MRFLPDHGKPTVAVVGMGYVGSCVAATLADRGFDVRGIDTDSALVARLGAGGCPYREPGLGELIRRRAGRGLSVTGDAAGLADRDVVLITVGSPVHADGSLADGQLRAACESLGGRLRPGQLVMLKSTVPPGTTRRLVASLLESGGLTCGTDFGLAFCPERLSEGSALAEFTGLPVVVGGWCPDSAAAARAFWARALDVEPFVVGSLEAAEMVKLADNWWIDTNIALANELARLCTALGVDALEVIEAANTLLKGGGSVNILLPGVGVGGSCLTKDPWMVHRAALRHGLTLRTVAASRAANDEMPLHTAGQILDGLARLGRAPARSTVAVLGLAYKNNTGDLRETPVAPVVRALTAAGVQVRMYDPLVAPEEARRTFGLPLADSLDEAVTGADCVAFLAYHREFTGLDFAALAARTGRPCLVMDGRAYFDRETVERLRGHGFSYTGIGR